MDVSKFVVNFHAQRVISLATDITKDEALNIIPYDVVSVFISKVVSNITEYIGIYFQRRYICYSLQRHLEIGGCSGKY